MPLVGCFLLLLALSSKVSVPSFIVWLIGIWVVAFWIGRKVSGELEVEDDSRR